MDQLVDLPPNSSCPYFWPITLSEDVNSMSGSDMLFEHRAHELKMVAGIKNVSNSSQHNVYSFVPAPGNAFLVGTTAYVLPSPFNSL